MGYYVKLIFLNLPNADMAMARVAARVAQGGHDVPEDIIRRRYSSGFRNFENIYKDLVDAWILYDNSGSIPIFLDWGEKK
jgi:predicted ABC-type ATPase